MEKSKIKRNTHLVKLAGRGCPIAANSGREAGMDDETASLFKNKNKSGNGRKK